LLIRVNPVTAGERYLGKIVVHGHAWTADISLLVSPIVSAVVLAGVALILSARLVRLQGGVSA
jgi:ABC-2 type transport system permease protein